MRYIKRHMETQVLKATKAFPAVALTGPRRSGKTFLLQHLLPKADYYLFEDPDIISRFRHDPQGFLDNLKTPAILDEVQNVPEIFNYVRTRIDQKPRKMGQWYLTGSQETGLMQNITESMAGRVAILQLWPMSHQENPKVTLLRGGYPEVLARPGAASLWFSSYLQTYLERDVRSIMAVQDLITFRRFLALVASRHGQILNKSDLAAPLGMSVPSMGRWLSILEATAQIVLVPPYFENLGKRLIKSPKLYLADPGLACHLLGIETVSELNKSPFLGALFEGLLVSEIIKGQLNAGRRKEVYYFRDQQGLEVDFLVPGRSSRIHFIEAKAAKTVTPDMAKPMLKLQDAWKRKCQRSTPNMTITHLPQKASISTRALTPGVQAIPWPELIRELI